jgi:hypothetical protein
MGLNDKLLGWLRKEPDEAESDKMKDAEADQIDEHYSDEKADAGTDLRFGRSMGDSDR